MFNNNIARQNSTLGSVVISGASSGIGEATAIYLDRLGYQVFAGVRRETDALSLVQKSSGTIIPIILDVTDEASITAAIDLVKMRSDSGGLTALINNAAIVIPSILEFMPIDEMKKEFEVNVFGLVALTKACIPLLRKAKGKVVNISSLSGKLSMPTIGTYSASKFAVEAISDALRLELKAWEIDVCIVQPGLIKTAVWEKSRGHGSRLWDSLPAEKKQLYATEFEIMYEYTKRSFQDGIPREKVAETIGKAVSAKRVKARYPVGIDTKIVVFLARFVPALLLDKIVTLFLGYPTKVKTETIFQSPETIRQLQPKG